VIRGSGIKCKTKSFLSFTFGDENGFADRAGKVLMAEKLNSTINSSSEAHLSCWNG
jgi:hypothetical protein